MKFVVAVFSPPHSPASRRALRFTEALLAARHEAVRLFFYQDGVQNASGNIVQAQDEADIARQWQQLIEQHRLDSVVCIGSALRRGLLDAEESQRHGRPASNVQSPWLLSGLGQLHEAIQQADRFISFGGH